jgi:pimeloyl-ACP methyl ester carboxylesterase
MRKVILSAILLFSFSCLFSQDDMEQLSKQADSLMKNRTGVPYGNNPATGKYYDIRGFKMYAEVYGTGAPVLIIHGNGGSISNFIRNIPYFEKKYKVIIADSRAQGKSFDTKNDSLSYEMMADDYAALLDAMKIDSANVIGWSDGGINGLLLAMRHPKKVKMLAITGANLWPDTNAVFQEVWDMVMPEYNSLKGKTNMNPMEKQGWKMLRLLCEQPNIKAAELSKVKCPTLVIGGDHDVIKEEHTMLIYKSIPRAYLWILPASGHSTPVIYAEDFNKNIDNFFQKPYRVIKGAARFL